MIHWAEPDPYRDVPPGMQSIFGPNINAKRAMVLHHTGLVLFVVAGVFLCVFFEASKLQESPSTVEDIFTGIALGAGIWSMVVPCIRNTREEVVRNEMKRAAKEKCDPEPKKIDQQNGELSEYIGGELSEPVTKEET